MSKVSGVDKREYLYRLYGTAKNEIEGYVKDSVENYKKLVAQYQDEHSLGFWDWASLIIWPQFTILRGLIEGGADLFTGFMTLGADFLNNAAHIFDESDGTDWQQDVVYMFKDLEIDFKEGVGVAFLGTAAEIGGLFGADKSWAYGENGAIAEASKQSNKERAAYLTGNLNMSPEEAKKLIESRYDTNSSKYSVSNPNDKGMPYGFLDNPYKYTYQVIQDSNQLNNWFKNNVTSILQLPAWKQMSQQYSGFNFFDETFLNIGRMIPSIAISYAAPQLGLSALTTKILANTYFGASVFGSSFNQALNNGSSISDAYTFAIGNAGLELATEAIGGIKLGEQITKYTLGQFISMALEEGTEEVMSEVAGKGFSYYSNPDHKIDTASNVASAWANLFYAFAGGAVSSLAIGGGAAVVNRFTPDGQAQSAFIDLNKMLSTSEGKINQEIFSAKLSKILNKMVDSLNSEEVSPEFKKMVLEDGFEIHGRTFKMSDILETTKSNGASQYSLNDKGQQLLKGDIFGKQNGESISHKTHAISSDSFNDYQSEIETVNEKGGIVKQKISIITKQEVNSLEDSALKQKVKWALKNVDSIVFAKNTSGGGQWAAFTDKHGRKYININSQDAIDGLVVHELTHVLDNLSKEKRLTIGGNAYWNAFTKLFDKNSVIDDIVKAIKEISPDFELFDEKKYDKIYENRKNKADLIKQEKIAHFVQKFFGNEKVLSALMKKNQLFEKLSEIFNKKANYEAFLKKLGLGSVDLKQYNSVFEIIYEIQKSFKNALKINAVALKNNNLLIDKFSGLKLYTQEGTAFSLPEDQTTDLSPEIFLKTNVEDFEKRASAQAKTIFDVIASKHKIDDKKRDALKMVLMSYNVFSAYDFLFKNAQPTFQQLYDFIDNFLTSSNTQMLPSNMKEEIFKLAAEYIYDTAQISDFSILKYVPKILTSKKFNEIKIVADKNNALFNANCLSIAETIKKQNIEIDAIIVDPPYEHDGNIDLNKKEVWDRHDLTNEWIKAYSPLLKNGAAIISFADKKQISAFQKAFQENGIVLKELLVWQKTAPNPMGRESNYTSDKEFIIYGVKGDGKGIFNYQVGDKYSSSIFNEMSPRGNERVHPTQKPTSILETLIRRHTNIGNVIFDPFMGSGSTGVAAANSNRKFMGIEQNKEYFKLAIERIKTAQEARSQDDVVYSLEGGSRFFTPNMAHLETYKPTPEAASRSQDVLFALAEIYKKTRRYFGYKQSQTNVTSAVNILIEDFITLLYTIGDLSHSATITPEDLKPAAIKAHIDDILSKNIILVDDYLKLEDNLMGLIKNNSEALGNSKATVLVAISSAFVYMMDFLVSNKVIFDNQVYEIIKNALDAGTLGFALKTHKLAIKNWMTERNFNDVMKSVEGNETHKIFDALFEKQSEVFKQMRDETRAAARIYKEQKSKEILSEEQEIEVPTISEIVSPSVPTYIFKYAFNKVWKADDIIKHPKHGVGKVISIRQLPEDSEPVLTVKFENYEENKLILSTHKDLQYGIENAENVVQEPSTVVSEPIKAVENAPQQVKQPTPVIEVVNKVVEEPKSVANKVKNQTKPENKVAKPAEVIVDKVGEIPLEVSVVKNKEERVAKIKSHIRVFSYIWSKYNRTSSQQQNDIEEIKKSKAANVEEMIQRRKNFSAFSKKMALAMKSVLSIMAQGAQITDNIFEDSKYIKFPKEPAINFQEREVIRALEENRREIEGGKKPFGEKSIELEMIRQMSVFYEGLLKMGLMSYKGLYNLHSILMKKKYLPSYKGFEVIAEQLKNETFASKQAPLTENVSEEQAKPKVTTKKTEIVSAKEASEVLLAVGTPKKAKINVTQERINEAVHIGNHASKEEYMKTDREYSTKIDEITKKVSKSTSAFDKRIFRIIKDNNDYIRKIIVGNKVVNHLAANVSYHVVELLNDSRKSIKSSDGGKTFNFDDSQKESLRFLTNTAIFTALSYVDQEVTVEINKSDENPQGFLFTKAIYWFFRDMLKEEKWNNKKADAYRQDSRGKEYWDLMDSIDNIEQPQGMENFIRALKKFGEATEVDTITDMALHTVAFDEPNTIHTVRGQWDSNLKVLNSINNTINRKVKINSTMDAYTAAETVSGFQEDSWGNVLMRKIAQGNLRQLQIRRIFDNVFNKEWLKKNYKKVVSLEKQKEQVTVKNLGDAKLRLSQVIYLRTAVLREILRNRFIENKRMNGKQTHHFDDGNEIEILDIAPDMQKKKDNAVHAKLTTAVELYNELDAIVQNNVFMKEYADMVGDMFEQFFPYINERFKEINGQPLQNEGKQIANSINDNNFKGVMLKGFTRELSASELNKTYSPFLLSSGNYFNKETVKPKDILDLGIFDGMTQEMTDSNGIISVESITNVIFEYTNEVSNYYGLHRIFRDLNIILRQEMSDSKQTRYLSDMIPTKIMEYFEMLLKDMAGYKNPPRNKTFKRISTFIRRNFYRMALGANFKVIFTQFATVINLSTIYGTGNTFFFDFVKNLYAQHTKQNKATLKQLKDTDNIYWERTLDSTYEMGEAAKGGLEAYNTFNRVMGLLMRGISFTDTAINNAFYLTLLETVNPETGRLHTILEAQKKLDDGILRSQSSASDMTKSPWLRSDSDIIRIMLKFMGEPLKLITQIESSVIEVSYTNKIIKNSAEITKKMEQDVKQAKEKADIAKNNLMAIEETLEDEDFSSMDEGLQKTLISEQNAAEKANKIAQRDLQNSKERLEQTKKHIDNIVKGKAQAQNRLVRRVGALISTVTYLSILNFIFAMVRTKGGKKDKPEDEDMVEYLLTKFGMAFADELIGMIPFVRDAYQALAKGFDFADIDEARSINELTQTLYYLFADLASGDDIKWSKTLYNLMKSISGIFGIPFTNIERLITTPLLYISESAHYQYNAFFGKQTRDNVEMAEAIKNNDDKMIAAIVNNKISKRNILVSNATQTELVRLAKTGNEVIMSGVNDKYTVDGVEYEITSQQKEEFADIYNKADLVIQRIIRTSDYKRLSDAKKKTLLQAIYNYYYQYAKEKVLDVEILPEATHFKTLKDAYNYFIQRASSLYNQQKKEQHGN